MKLGAVALTFLLAVALYQPAIGGPRMQAQAEAAPGQLLPLPTDRDGLERRGDLMMVRKDYREAVDIYQKALALAPKSAVLYNKVGIAWHQQFRLDPARRCYEKAIQLDRKYSEAVNNLGTIFYAQKKYSSAIRRYESALKLNPQAATFHYNLGTAQFARKRYQEAFLAYREALRLDPEIFERRSGFGMTLQERSVEDRAMFHFYLAKTYAAAGLADKALEYLRKAFEDGFKDKQKIEQDQSFAELIKMPAYAELMQNLPTPLKP